MAPGETASTLGSEHPQLRLSRFFNLNGCVRISQGALYIGFERGNLVANFCHLLNFKAAGPWAERPDLVLTLSFHYVNILTSMVLILLVGWDDKTIPFFAASVLGSIPIY